MNKLIIKELQVLLPYLIYMAIIFACIMLVTTAYRIVKNKQQQQLKIAARKNNFLYSRLLTANDLNSKDPIIMSQKLKAH